MFRISPTFKDNKSKIDVSSSDVMVDPLTAWTTEHNFRFPPALTIHNSTIIENNTRLRVIYEVPSPHTSFYFTLSQYNPWLDCEMTREKREHLKPVSGEVCYPVYFGPNCDMNNGGRPFTNFFRNETIIDIIKLYLWPLLYSRADDVIACSTFAHWQRLFRQTIILAFPDYDYWCSIACSRESVNAISTKNASTVFVSIYDQRRTAQIMKYMTPARVLYLLTTRANLWPYGPLSSGSISSAIGLLRGDSVVGAGNSTRHRQNGICSIKPKIKEYTDKTPIEWLVTAEFLRKMKRVHVYVTYNPSHSDTLSCAVDSDSD